MAGSAFQTTLTVELKDGLRTGGSVFQATWTGELRDGLRTGVLHEGCWPNRGQCIEPRINSSIEL